MDIDTFIMKHSPEWRRLETACSRGADGLANLSGTEIADVIKLYLRVSGHLSEVQTRYHDPRLENYLNSVVTRAHGSIYSAHARTFSGFLRFFGSRYRHGIARTSKYIAVAAVILLFSWISIQVWVTYSDEARAALIPPQAAEQIEEAGNDTNPEHDIAEAAFSTFILTNNVRVSFLAFAAGISFGVGTIWLLVMNGVLIGAIAGASHAAGFAGRFYALVLPHGFLEIVAICIAAGAGLRIGWSLVDPGDRMRSQALADEAKEAVLVVLGVVPAFALAAFYEGFLTGSGLPDGLEIAIGAATALAYIVFLWGRPGASKPAIAAQ